MSPTDQHLVDRCRGGDRDAFAEIVARYQNLICSIAYGSTGSLSASEDLAQETFVSAWRSIGDLREPERLRQWLSGIVRNLARSSVRRQSRDILHCAGPIEETAASASSPVEATIAREEAALMDRALEVIPETYRQPLVLYYREQESVARVAELLELSEDAVKQRLSRGRKMLRSQMADVVERGLRRSAPGRAFTVGVIAALPVMTGTAKAATVTATGAKGASAMQAAGWMGMLGAIIGPIVGIVGAWFGVRMSLKAARSERERTFIRRTAWVMFGFALAFTLALLVLVRAGREFAQENPKGFAVAIVVLVLGYTVGLLAAILFTNRRQARIRHEEGMLEASADDVAAQYPKVLRRWQYPAIYESPRRLLGLPLVSVRFNGVVGDPSERRAAIGWIAIGDKAVGVLFAGGAFAVGGIACGAISVGIVSLAGLAIGLVAFGGGAVGAMAYGGAAIGILAWGGCAVAWKAAMGGLAVAHEFAVGGMAVAAHSNDELAKQFMTDDPFFQAADFLGTNGWLFPMLIVAAMAPLLWARRFVERASRA